MSHHLINIATAATAGCGIVGAVTGGWLGLKNGCRKFTYGHDHYKFCNQGCDCTTAPMEYTMLAVPDAIVGTIVGGFMGAMSAPFVPLAIGPLAVVYYKSK
jgi:hypothetical protein